MSANRPRPRPPVPPGTRSVWAYSRGQYVLVRGHGAGVVDDTARTHTWDPCVVVTIGHWPWRLVITDPTAIEPDPTRKGRAAP